MLNVQNIKSHLQQILKTYLKKLFDSGPNDHIIDSNDETDQLITNNNGAVPNEINLKQREIGTMTDLTMEQQNNNLKKRIVGLENENKNMRKNMSLSSTYNQILSKSEKIFMFHTGLFNKIIFFALLNLLEIWHFEVKVNLKPCEQLLLDLMKLRLGLRNQDLATRFDIGVGTVSKVFLKWLDVLYGSLKNLIKWPHKNRIKHLSKCFQNQNVLCIDCSEIFIEKAQNLLARAQTYSVYKNHDTIKFLVAITPSGSMFHFTCMGGGEEFLINS